jgi:hypothetical protein
MKKLLMIGSALALLSSSAYATTARLLALGMNETDNEGSYYIQDQRNVFLNPAYVNIYSDYAVMEWGSTGRQASVLGTDSAATVGQPTSPKAQGGVFKKFGDFVYGVYLGNESNTSALLRVAGSSAASTLDFDAATLSSKMLPTADNQVDFFVGSDMGMKWGANLTLSKGENESRTSKDSAGAVRLGVIGSNWDAHANISFNSESEATETIQPLAVLPAVVVTQKFDGTLGFHVGGSLEALNGRVFGYVKHYGWEQSDSYNNYAVLSAATTGSATLGNTPSGGQFGTIDGDFTSYYLGWGNSVDVNNGDKLFMSLAAKKTDINLEFTNKGEIRHLIIPVTFGYEAKALEWLILRGSVVQNLWGQRDNKGLQNLNLVARNLIGQLYGSNGKSTIAGSTAVNAGATLTFGQLNVDGLIGMTSASRQGTNTAGANHPTTNNGVLALDNLEATVGVTYKF